MNVRVAGALLGAALALLLISAWRAARVEQVAPLPSVPTTGAPLSGHEERAGYSLPRIMEAVDKDPFHPLRRRPARRLQAAGAAGNVVSTVADNGLSIQVVGTAVSASGGGGFAMCAWGGAPPRIVRVGERVGDWTLKAVTPGAAQFTSASGATVVVRIAKAGEGS